MNLSKEEKLLFDIYRAVYKEIGVDFDALIESGETRQDGWFSKYFLEETRQKEILENMLKNKKISKLNKQRIRNSYWLGCSPVGLI